MDAIPVLDWYEHGKGESTVCRHSHLYLSFLSLSVIPAKAGTQNSVSEHSPGSTSNSDESNKTT